MKDIQRCAFEKFDDTGVLHFVNVYEF